jgi:NAD(P)-dependent dehydrogenase (short-subunit alcohol dehydrogenase family)
MFDLAGRVAVVTGGTKGIGLSIARALKAQGADVACWARQPAAAEVDLEQAGLAGFECDITDDDSVAAAMAATLERFGRVDVLVASAARPGEDVLFPGSSIESWTAIIDTNLTGTFRTVQSFAGHAIERGGGGKVIVISSIAAEFAMPRAIGYATSKAGLVGFVHSAASALARHDIQVNGVEPGWVATEMSAPQLQDDRVGQALLRHTPARRFGTGDDLAGICVYLASSASGFHTADMIRVDGGFSVS